jgi:hypothetical protein
MIQVRGQRCSRFSLSGGTRSKVVDSVLAVASVVRTVVLGVGVITSRSSICGERYRCLILLSHLNNTSNLIWRTTLLPHKYYNCSWSPEICNCCRQSQSQSHVTTDGQSVCPGVKFTLEIVTRYYFFVWKLLCCLCGAPSLTRGRVCLLSVAVISV